MIKEWIELFFGLLQSDTVRITLIVCLVLCGSLIEWVFPAQKYQPVSGRLRNIGHIFFFLFLGTASLALIFLWVSVQPRIQSVSGGSLVGLFFCGLFLSDFVFYWYHRAQHTFAWLWPIHELHHSDTQLNVTTSMRSYWLEYPLQVFLIATPVHLIVGVHPEVLFLALFVMTIWLFFAHTNIRLALGKWTLLFGGPQWHRIHHSIEKNHQDKNFAQFFPIIDKVFGTYYEPQKDEFPATGTAGLSTDASYIEVFFKPFHDWKKLLTSLVGKK